MNVTILASPEVDCGESSYWTTSSTSTMPFKSNVAVEDDDTRSSTFCVPTRGTRTRPLYTLPVVGRALAAYNRQARTTKCTRAIQGNDLSLGFVEKSSHGFTAMRIIGTERNDATLATVQRMYQCCVRIGTYTWSSRIVPCVIHAPHNKAKHEANSACHIRKYLGGWANVWSIGSTCSTTFAK